jgi:hypothetical protein
MEWCSALASIVAGVAHMGAPIVAGPADAGSALRPLSDALLILLACWLVGWYQAPIRVLQRWWWPQA